MYNKKLTLSNGVKIPQLGLGNERGVGEGIRTCGIPREELFVVSKVAAEHKTYEDAKANLW